MRPLPTPESTVFDFGEVQIIGNIVIAIMKEGIVFNPEYNEVLMAYCKSHFKEASYGYISYRKNSYAIDPTVYIQTANKTKVCAIAIVSLKTIDRLNASVEKQFFEHPFEVFDNLTLATQWMENVLAKKTAHREQS
ncbi:MAG: hypothetical protein ABNH00_07605 [Dokdonia sp.]|jgi:hypothetical protein|nr:hypothetical protein [Cytophagaceae bacterium]|tara:strand:- start:1235 stop:1642 length:408 start_codon:yes stop_codon:yes gene_type:complete